jgi:hypothetical protein
MSYRMGIGIVMFAALVVGCGGGGTTTDGTGGAGGGSGGAGGGSGGSTSSGTTGDGALDPDTAPVAEIDRFQDGFATLFKRSGPVFDPMNVSKVVPEPNAPIDMDNFLVMALGPAGEKVTYYSLDIVPPVAREAYSIVGADGKPIKDQLPIIDSIPGDKDYTDFFTITQVTVKDGYVANTLHSVADVEKAIGDGSATEKATDQMVNWSVVPKGTTAKLKFLGKTVTGFRAWYDDKVAYYMEFETDLKAPADNMIPTVPIYVIFKDDMSPAMGFATEAGSKQTHNVIALLPGQAGYSSYWDHSVGKLSGFDTVTDLASAEANVKAKAPVIVNCPVVE